MDKRQRIEAALRGEAIDRVPLSLWRHFFCEDRTAEGLAEITLGFAQAYDLDLVKLTPCGLYAVEDWAGQRITYPGNDYDPPYLFELAVTNPEAWRRLLPLQPKSGALGRELEAIRLVAEGLAGRTPGEARGAPPLMMTVFSPLTLAYKLAGDHAITHLREHPSSLHAGLETITETTIALSQAALQAGADGLFFATQLASYQYLTPAEYEAFGVRYDLAVLETVAGKSAITVLHLHGREVFFDLANCYPIHAVSWHDRETQPSLAEARKLTDRAFVTGLDREILSGGPVAAIQAQVREALNQTNGRSLILAPSCVIPPAAPDAHLEAVQDALHRPSSLLHTNGARTSRSQR